MISAQCNCWWSTGVFGQQQTYQGSNPYWHPMHSFRCAFFFFSSLTSFICGILLLIGMQELNTSLLFTVQYTLYMVYYLKKVIISETVGIMYGVMYNHPVINANTKHQRSLFRNIWLPNTIFSSEGYIIVTWHYLNTWHASTIMCNQYD